VSKTKPIEFYIEGITLKEALQNGLIVKLLQQVEKAGVKIVPAVITIDPLEEREGLIRIGHHAREEALKGGLRISFDPRISEHTIEAFKKALEEVFAGER